MATIQRVRRNIVSSLDVGAIDRAGAEFGFAADVASGFAQRKQQLEDAAAKTEVAKKNAEYNRQMNKLLAENQSMFAGNPSGSVEDFNVKVDALTNQFSTEMNTEQSRALFNDSASIMKQQFGSKHDSWIISQTTQNTITNIEDTANSYKEQAYEAGKSSDFSQLQNIQNMSGDVVASANGVLASDELTKLNEGTRKQNASAFLDGMTRNNPTGAIELIASGELDEIFTSQEKDIFLDKASRSAETKAKAVLQLKRDDPLGFFEMEGEAVPNIDLNDPNTFQDRADFVESKRNLNPELNIPILRKGEVDDLVNIINRGNPQETVKALQKISIVTPFGFADEVAEQLFEKQPSYGVAMSLSEQAPDVSLNIIRGQKFIDEKAVPLPPDDAILATVSEQLGNAIGDPEALRDIFVAAKADYTARAFDAGNTDGKFLNSDLLNNSIKSVIGDIAEINGNKTVTFRDITNKVVDAGKFQDAFDDMTDTDIIQTGQQFPAMGGKPLDAEFIKEWGKLIPIADGQYRIHLKTNNTYLTKGNGEPYVLNFKAIYNYKLSENK